MCSDNFTCCHTEKEAANQTFYLTQSQQTDSLPADPITPGAWQVASQVPNPVASGIRSPHLLLSRRTPTMRYTRGRFLKAGSWRQSGSEPVADKGKERRRTRCVEEGREGGSGEQARNRYFSTPLN